MRRISLSLLFVAISVFTVLGQDPAAAREAEKLKSERQTKLVDAILLESGQLKLPENRAYVAAKLGAAVWKNDPERGSTLFKNAVDGLLTAQTFAEANKTSNNQFHDLLTSQSLRPTILNTIASLDAEFALDSFYRSRPLAIQKAMSQSPTRAKITSGSDNYPHLAQQEINLEQRLIKMVAQQKPERSLAILKENIKKHLSGETLAMLKTVWDKEPVVGNELANDVADRLISKSFFGGNNQVNHELINLSTTILVEHIQEHSPQEKRLRFDDARMRTLARKIISTYLERGNAIGYIPLHNLEPIAKHFSPGSNEHLKKAAENTGGFGRHGIMQIDGQYAKLMSTNPTAETMIAEAKKFPMETRRSVYVSAANKLSDAGQYDRAIALLHDNFEEDALENAISSMNWYYAHLLINRGDFDGAEAMIMQFNESNRIAGMTSLAMTVYSRNPEENRARALGMLQRVRSFLPSKPETNNELSQLFQLINTLAAIEPNEAFRNLEPVIDQVNELAEAWAVVNGFQGGYNIRQGEYLLSGGFNFGVQMDASIFSTLARKDFARTVTVIDSLNRREMRIHLLMNLLESGI